MDLIDKVKALFSEAKVEEKFADYKLADGSIIRVEALEEGQAVQVMQEDGTLEQAPAGEHELEDGQKIVVDEEGNIAEIIEAEGEAQEEQEPAAAEMSAETAEAPEAEAEKAQEDETEAETTAEADQEDNTEKRITELEEAVMLLVDKLKDFETSNEAVEAEMQALKAENEELKATTPAAEPVKFKKIDTHKEAAKTLGGKYADFVAANKK